ncbi:type II toxin-antitoxin system VapC family toxin [Nostoc sp. C057]|uniref:type II toxin-antitoxin system VapC family toxin n=1 Tax=Nostoc sp. C057 TaxID=2576903 RepID=UPI0015C3C0A2|nr:PIN domain-containing protein [Nostoc sp. C057]
MTSVVADTHALIWYIFDLERLSKTALTALEQAVSDGNPIYVSAISVVEISYLVEKGRFAQEVLTRILNALDDPNMGVVLAPLYQFFMKLHRIRSPLAPLIKAGLFHSIS